VRVQQLINILVATAAQGFPARPVLLQLTHTRRKLVAAGTRHAVTPIELWVGLAHGGGNLLGQRLGGWIAIGIEVKYHNL
jgi:hypothetical protein